MDPITSDNLLKWNELSLTMKKPQNKSWHVDKLLVSYSKIYFLGVQLHFLENASGVLFANTSLQEKLLKEEKFEG